MHLVIATPCYGGLVHQRYMQSICNLLYEAGQQGLRISVEMIGYESLVTRGRNSLVAKFLDTPGATHLLFIDADIGFTPDQVGRLLKFDRPVTAGMYPLKIIHYDRAVSEFMAQGESLEAAQLRYVGVLEEGERLEQVDGFATGTVAGAGFMMIKRETLELMIQAYPETRYSLSHTSADPSRSPNQYALFDCIIDPVTGHYLSEDYAFCHRWRAIGGKVWLDTRSKLTHIGAREFVGDCEGRFNASTLQSLAARG